MSLIIFLIVVFGNVWLWKMFNFNSVLGFLMLAASILLYLYSQRENGFLLAGFLIILILGLFRGCGLQQPILGLNEQETLLSQQRLNEYPPITWLPIAHWLEERRETVGFYKLIGNFSEVVNPNLYFFANHPRERAAVIEIEKFSYILLPLFIFGTFLFVSEGKVAFFVSSFFIPLIYYSIVGIYGKIDPYLLFPFITVTISKGFSQLKKDLLIVFLILFVLVLTQSFIYAKF